MVIGVDVDGVLVDTETYQIRTGTEYFKNKYNKNVINPKGYDIEDIFACNHSEREKFWFRYIWAYCLSEPVMPFAVDSIKKLHNDGYSIVIITSRAHTSEKNFLGALFRKMLLYWLKKNNVYYDKIIYCSEKNSHDDKLKVCINEKIDVMIDDKPENLIALSDKIKVICYPAVWNEKLQNDNIIRVKDWKEIYKVISSMKGTSKNG